MSEAERYLVACRAAATRRLEGRVADLRRTAGAGVGPGRRWIRDHPRSGVAVAGLAGFLVGASGLARRASDVLSAAAIPILWTTARRAATSMAASVLAGRD